MQLSLFLLIDDDVFTVVKQFFVVKEVVRIEYPQESYQPKDEQESREYPRDI